MVNTIFHHHWKAGHTMILSEEIAARVVRLTEEGESLAAGDNVYWRNEEDDGIATVVETLDNGAIVRPFGQPEGERSVRSFNRSLWAKVHYGSALPVGTPIVTVQDSTNGYYIRTRAGVVGERLGTRTSPEGDGLARVGTHDQWIGGHLALTPAVVTPQEVTPQEVTPRRWRNDGTAPDGTRVRIVAHMMSEWVGKTGTVSGPNVMLDDRDLGTSVDWTEIEEIAVAAVREQVIVTPVTAAHIGERFVVTATGAGPVTGFNDIRVAAGVFGDWYSDRNGRMFRGGRVVRTTTLPAGTRVAGVSDDSLDGGLGVFGTVLHNSLDTVRHDGPCTTDGRRGIEQPFSTENPIWHRREVVLIGPAPARRFQNDNTVPAGMRVKITQHRSRPMLTGSAGSVGPDRQEITLDDGRVTSTWTEVMEVTEAPEAPEVAEFTPTWDNPAPGVTYTGWRGELRTEAERWSRENLEIGGMRGIQQVTIGERETISGRVGTEGYLVGAYMQEITTGPRPVFSVMTKGGERIYNTDHVIPGWDVLMPQSRWSGGTYYLTQDFVPRQTGVAVMAGTALECHTLAQGVMYSWVDGLEIKVPTDLLSREPLGRQTLPEWTLDQSLSGEALTSALEAMLAAATERRVALWRRLDQAAVAHDWCGDYERFSDRVGGLADRESVEDEPEERTYVFTVDVTVRLDANDLDTLLRGHLTDDNHTRVDVRDDVEVVNRVEITYSTTDPDGVEVSELMEHANISNYTDADIYEYEEA